MEKREQTNQQAKQIGQLVKWQQKKLWKEVKYRKRSIISSEIELVYNAILKYDKSKSENGLQDASPQGMDMDLHIPNTWQKSWQTRDLYSKSFRMKAKGISG